MKKKINYHNKKFKPLSSTGNSEITEEIIFLYKQNGDIIHCTYKGGPILYGHLIGIVDTEGQINMRYHQINDNGDINTGICISRPEISSENKIILHEKWQWTSGDESSGSSILIEI